MWFGGFLGIVGVSVEKKEKKTPEKEVAGVISECDSETKILEILWARDLNKVSSFESLIMHFYVFFFSEASVRKARRGGVRSRQALLFFSPPPRCKLACAGSSAFSGIACCSDTHIRTKRSTSQYYVVFAFPWPLLIRGKGQVFTDNIYE